MRPVRPGPGGASLIEAFFTAVSAICVTGLTIVDTPVAWTGFGQVVILVLIQVGGLGVMTFASVIGIAVVRRLSLRSRLTAAVETKSTGLLDVRSVVTSVARISLVIEAGAALILFLWFLPALQYPLGKADWFAIFHAVSSFNNAGFALFSDNMMGFVNDPVVSLTRCASIILGGLGFPVLVQLRRQWRRPLVWTSTTRIVVWATIVLILAGTLYITAIEWSNPATLGPLDWPGKILAGFFQSVQTRTAGFNSVDIGAMDEASWVGMAALMFIGGGSAGTAGGIKVTTFAVLLFVAVVVIATIAIMLMTDYPLGRVLFGTVSAFGTVGLSDGITANLPVGAQLVLTALMFLGRLGPITFASALALRDRQILYQLPKERPIIG